MGDAKRKKAAAAGAAQSLGAINPAHAAAAVRQVVQAITDFHGADCLLYASIGAHLLRSLGVEAQAVAGSAAWRIGPGDGDVISHAREIQGPRYGHADAVRAGMFHAWIAGPGLLADFTTFLLPLKATLLDEADGGTTAIDWAPEYLWLTGPAPQPGQVPEPDMVRMAADAKVFCYLRHSNIEAIVLANREAREAELQQAYFAVKASYSALRDNRPLQVVGVGEHALQVDPVVKPIARMEPRGV